MLEGYYIIENSGVVSAGRRFKFKDLRAWGYDLHLGTIGGERAYFVSGRPHRHKIRIRCKLRGRPENHGNRGGPPSPR